MRCGARAFTLKGVATFGRAYVLTENAAAVGWIRRRGFFGRQYGAELPDDLPLECKVFLIWLVIVLWQRQRRAAVSAAVAGAASAGVR